MALVKKPYRKIKSATALARSEANGMLVALQLDVANHSPRAANVGKKAYKPK